MTPSKGALAVPYYAETEEEQANLQELQSARQKLQEALEGRNRLFDPVLLAMAQGFLAPTPTGKFGESLANVAKAVAPAQEAEEKRGREIAQMRADLAAMKLGQSQEAQKRSLMGSLYKQEKPGEEYLMDPTVALQLARRTGDPKIFEQLNVQQKQQRVRNLGQNLFADVEVPIEGGTRKEVKFNPNAAMELVRASDNPMEALSKYASMIPQLRKSGMFSDLKGDESTPFDAMIMMADSIGDQGPAIKQQAQRLASQYKKGLIDEDKAMSLSQQMLNMATGLMDKQQARSFNQTMAVLSHNLAETQAQASRDAAADRAQMARERLQTAREAAEDRADARRRELEGKLTDEQKIDYRQNVVPIIQEGIKANSALMQVTALKNVIAKAPSGAIAGAGAQTIGRLFGTDENTALRQLEGLSKGLITMIPRLPGAQSNLDAQNLEKSIMRLQDITLTNKQRLDLVNEIETGFKKLLMRADNVQSQWESTKKFDVRLLNEPTTRVDRPVPTAADISYGKNPAYREAFKNKFGKYPEQF
jgi:hypothetical protein